MRASKEPSTEFAWVIHAHPRRLSRGGLLITCHVPNFGSRAHFAAMSRAIEVDNVVFIVAILHVVVSCCVCYFEVLYLVQRRRSNRYANGEA